MQGRLNKLQGEFSGVARALGSLQNEASGALGFLRQSNEDDGMLETPPPPEPAPQPSRGLFGAFMRGNRSISSLSFTEFCLWCTRNHIAAQQASSSYVE
jgi:hypothetical protein